MKPKYEGDYYLGMNLGVDSAGWAVTDEEYHILKFHGKNMWGIRLFDKADTAKERHLFRTKRRRIQRRGWRIQLLQELFAEEMCKVDAGFFQKLKESALISDDYTLFQDEDYTDADYYREYPTIYHLRKALMTENRAFDVRLVYLALHHIVKYRGHFLLAGTMENVTSFHAAYEQLKNCLADEFGIRLICSSEEALAEVLKNRHLSKKEKSSRVMRLLHCTNRDVQLKAVIGLICGMKCRLSEVFMDARLARTEVPGISFSEGAYEEIRESLEEILEERCNILDIIKCVYNWAVLADILADGEEDGRVSLSVAKVKLYEKHKRDLMLLKRIVRRYDKEGYKDFFQRAGKENYPAYIGTTGCNGKKQSVPRCTREEFLKSVKRLLVRIREQGGDAAVLNRIEKEIAQDSFLPVQVSEDNAVIPYQVHEIELKAILKNAEAYLPFLKERDEDGLSVSEKVKKLFSFRIPYYVGPLNTYCREHAWMVRKNSGEILPWNFEHKVDVDRSAEKFVRRMTNKCAYLQGKDVLPKNSLLYCEFMVWNELNSVTFGGQKLSPEAKQRVFEKLFKQYSYVTGSMLCNCLRREGIAVYGVMSGINRNFNASLNSYLDFKKIFGEEIEADSVQKMLEDIILWITLYGEDRKMLRRVIRRHYGEERISDEKLAKVCRLKYQGWGRLSKEFLDETEGVDKDSGEIFTVIQALRSTSDNLTQLLGPRYTFAENIERENKKEFQGPESVSYDSLLKEMPVSPVIKRATWQAVLIAEEIRKIMGKAPARIFLEVARKEEKKAKTESRKEQLIEVYKNYRGERNWRKELENREESDFRNVKLYLYYTQMGKCMYSGENIDLSQLYDAMIYDRDHIYPRSKTRDDSLDNLVLVRREINAKKSDGILSPDIQRRMWSFWRMLARNGLISREKYNRLMRSQSFTDEELAGFISRQLTDTRQVSKMVTGIFRQIYPESEVLYVKDALVSSFRREVLKRVRVRSINDYHHAKDAYLNIVVGNVYREMFTDNPLYWLKNNRGRDYNLNRMFHFDVKTDGRLIWKSGDDGTISVVRANYNKRDIRFTRYAIVNKGGFFAQQLVGKDANPGVPVKKGMDPRLYGGYKSVTPAYFALVESEGWYGWKQRTIESVPLYLEKEFREDENKFREYCENQYGLYRPRILIPRIKKNAYMIIDGFPMHLRGISGKNLLLQGAAQLLLSEDQERYIKNIENYIQRNSERKDKKKLLTIHNYDGITKWGNLEIYCVLCDKIKNTIYRHRPANLYYVFANKQGRFEALSTEQQCIVINEMLRLFQCRSYTADLRLIGEGANAGKVQKSKRISGAREARLIYQSVTGLFEQEVDLRKCGVQNKNML